MNRLFLYGVLGLGVGLVSIAVALTVGSVALPADAVWQSVWHHLSWGQTAAPDPTIDRIVWRIRMPRILMALVVGGGLSIVGVAMQTLVRNPLAEPYILGVSSGASAGASLFFLGFLPAFLTQALTLPLAAFIGALLAMGAVFLVARTGPALSTGRLLLAGVAVGALLASVTSFATFASPNPQKLQTVLFWLLGSFAGARWTALATPTLAALAGLGVLLGLARPMDAMLLGEEPAHSLGVSVERVKRTLIVLTAAVTGLMVAAAGVIGFVGLIIPHSVRALVGVPHRRVLPFSFLLGAIFLLWVDVAARTLLAGQELPIGVLTALCGAPFFLVLLRRTPYGFM